MADNIIENAINPEAEDDYQWLKPYTDMLIKHSVQLKDKSNASKTSVGKKYYAKKLAKNNKHIASLLQYVK